jgi:hypothetical protein
MSRPTSVFVYLFVAAFAAVPGFGAPSPGGSAPAAPALALKFSKVPLGNVMRVLSARYGVPFTIEANATAPITGDFAGLDLPAAVAEAARQAGLHPIPLGKDATAGFRLSLHPAPNAAASPAPPAAAADPASPPTLAPAPVAGESARGRLLQERARLLAAAARQDP